MEHSFNTLKLGQMAGILQTTFSNSLSWQKIVAFWFKSYWILILRVQLTLVSICWDNSLVPKKHQAVTWTNGGLVYWHTHTSLSLSLYIYIYMYVCITHWLTVLILLLLTKVFLLNSVQCSYIFHWCGIIHFKWWYQNNNLWLSNIYMLPKVKLIFLIS